MPAALAALDRALAGGAWVAGYAAYELGYAFEPRLLPLLPAERRLPLLEFGVFARVRDRWRRRRRAGRSGRSRRRGTARPTGAAFARVAAYIRAGDIYQANLTFPMRGRWSGRAGGAARRRWRRGSRSGIGALVALPGATLVSRSPELFFALDGAGGIETRPMKGTAPRDPDPARDAALRGGAGGRREEPGGEPDDRRPAAQRHLSRIAEIGSVRVPELFAVESYATVHQMVSAGHRAAAAGDAAVGRSSRRSFPAAR